MAWRNYIRCRNKMSLVVRIFHAQQNVWGDTLTPDRKPLQRSVSRRYTMSFTAGRKCHRCRTISSRNMYWTVLSATEPCNATAMHNTENLVKYAKRIQLYYTQSIPSSTSNALLLHYCETRASCLVAASAVWKTVTQSYWFRCSGICCSTWLQRLGNGKWQRRSLAPVAVAKDSSGTRNEFAKS